MLDFNKYYNPKNRVIWHIAFWIIYFSYHVFISGIRAQSYSTILIWDGITLPVKMSVAYFTLYFLLPKYFFTHQLFRFLLYLIAALVVGAILQRIILLTIGNQWLLPGLVRGPNIFSVQIIYDFMNIYPVVLLTGSIKIGMHWLEKDYHSRELQKEKLESELKFLKAQTHPHFLFNTLNNLYALTLIRSEDAPAVVVKLSELLSYVLYECNERTVLLEKELNLIKNYIALEQIRYGDRLIVSYNVDGNIQGKEIPPMLILPFVENSFKHGVSRQLELVWLTVDIKIEENYFHLLVENSIETEEEDENNQSYREGIGLSNVKRRLDLLYKENYQLDIKKIAGRFSVTLTLNLNHKLKIEPNEY